MLKNGFCIYLKRDFKYLLNIFSDPKEIEKRPKLKNLKDEKLSEKIKSLLNSREVFYSKANLTLSKDNIFNIKDLIKSVV